MKKELYKISYSLKKEARHRAFSIIATVVLIFVVLNLILHFVVFSVRQTSDSMENGIVKNSCILFFPYKKIQRGDVVLVEPKGKAEFSRFEKILNPFLTFFTAQQISFSKIHNLMGAESQIRRVIALPGDTIYMRDYVLYIRPSGEKFFLTEFELIDCAYDVSITASPALWDASLGVIGSFDEMTLESDEYFVLGDSRNGVLDSRLWGPVKRANIEASAIFQYFPLNEIKIF